MESSASIKRQIEVIYEQREVNDNNELEEEETYKEKIRLINQQIKRLLKQKEQLTNEFKHSQYVGYRCELNIRDNLNSLYRQLENIE
ncbi:unnamed protein product [Macrosiphum euphorbiae]|uniref:Uncharacterized protein n=1 Tax=Macrosiphum euphorbiae TaxID=13131 RepID=A0AAV0XT66_9HEMI|nr:unnamed protein product [Macrosiphum euphorbiae]